MSIFDPKSAPVCLLELCHLCQRIITDSTFGLAWVQVQTGKHATDTGFEANANPQHGCLQRNDLITTAPAERSRACEPVRL